MWGKIAKILQIWSVLGAGAVASLIFPPFTNAGAGYTALILFFMFLFGLPHTKKGLFWWTYLFGFAFYAVGFCWINNALLIDDDEFIAYVPLIILAIGLFFGLFWAIPALVSGWGKNIYAKMLVFTSVFVFMEWVRSFIFTGFPWNLLGTALSHNEALIQGAAYIGTYGLSLMLLLLCMGMVLIIRSAYRRRLDKGGILFIVVPLIFFIFAAPRFEVEKCLMCDEMNDFIVRLVQPSIPQTFKWHPALAHKNFRQYIDLSKKGEQDGYLPLDSVSLVVWGETASPYFLDRDAEHLAEIKEAIPQGGFLATGVLRLSMEKGEIVPYNSLFIINDNAEIKDYYDKAHLVPFGEYLPFREYWPEFMSPVADIVGNLGRGEQYKNMHVSGLPVMGGAVCYESIFPKEVLNPREKPEILLVVANDGWYGVSPGPYQHLAAAQMRAVEEGITVIRSANTGISAVISPYGKILGRIGLNEVGIADVSLHHPLAFLTFYGRFGNIIPLVLVLLVLLLALRLNVVPNRDS